MFGNFQEWLLGTSCLQIEEKERIMNFVFKKDAKSALVSSKISTIVLVNNFYYGRCFELTFLVLDSICKSLASNPDKVIVQFSLARYLPLIVHLSITRV